MQTDKQQTPPEQTQKTELIEQQTQPVAESTSKRGAIELPLIEIE